MNSHPWRRAAALLVPLALAAWAGRANAQVTDTLRLRERQQAAAADTTPGRDSARANAPRRRAAAADDDTTGQRRYRISPRTAFLRSLVLPGWGQSSIGAPGRGAVYFGLESASLWMVYKSNQKLQEAKELQRTQREQGLITVDQELGLVRARRNEREDWITLSVFWFFFSGADAFVSAYLRDFDAHVNVAPRPDGAAQLQVSIPLGH